MTGRMSIRASFALFVFLGGLAPVAISHAGFPSVKDVTGKAAKAVDKAKPQSEAKPAEGTEATSASPAASSGKVSDVSTKFDFVPGDNVLFSDDFKEDELGEFPARWKLVEGTFEVAEQQGERWLRCTSNDSHIRMKVSPNLPEFWTLEFDGSQLDAAGNTLTVTALTAQGGTAWETIFP